MNVRFRKISTAWGGALVLVLTCGTASAGPAGLAAQELPAMVSASVVHWRHHHHHHHHHHWRHHHHRHHHHPGR